MIDHSGVPDLAGDADSVERALRDGRARPVYYHGTVRLEDIDAACAVALHMHQPLIPAGAGIIGNLQWILEHQGLRDHHNPPGVRWGYPRMGEIIPQLPG